MGSREETLVIIPARGGSRGVPRKNIQFLAGKPLLAYSIEAAQQTPSVSRVIISTDDPEIAGVARRYDAEVTWRPEELSGDTATSESALLHTLEHLRETESYEPDLVVFLQATSPLRQDDDIKNAIKTLLVEKADSLFSACAVEGFLWRSSAEGNLPINYDSECRPRRQERDETILEENGSIYVFRPWVLRECRSRLGGKIAVYPMDRMDSFQVDNPDDLILMEHLLTVRSNSSRTSALADVELLVLDFDGVLTDNRVMVDQEGKEAVWCDRGDGWGIATLKDAGIDVLVISTEKNPVVSARCRKLEIECCQGCDDKLSMLQAQARRRSLGPEYVAYVGNDLNDVGCMRWVGFPIAVANAAPELRPVAQFITARRGGEGAVREVADWLLSARRRIPEFDRLAVKRVRRFTNDEKRQNW
jgi:N-acylneuraminate cytidylyltransferase